MDKPNSKEVSNFHRYFAIQSNNEFWALSEKSLDPVEKRKILTVAYTSLYHWQEVGTDQNIQLANLAVARAYCVNGSSQSVHYASLAFDYFDGSGESWIQAFTNAVLGHAFYIVGNNEKSAQLYENAVRLRSSLSEGDRDVFEATFKHIPVPRT
jgi:hypothetical protein